MATIASLVLSTGITSAVLQVLVDRIANFTRTKITQFTELQVELLKLGKTMQKAKVLVDDIENKKAFREDYRILLEDVKSLVLDAEDLLDEIDMELEFNGNQVRHMVQLYRKFNISSKVGKIHKELGDLVRDIFQLYSMLNSGQPQLAAPVTLTSSFVDESSIIGRGPDKEKIIQMVLSDNEGGENVSVIPIVGMGGIGKTALAQLVYNDPRVVQNFDFKIWESVSLSYDVVRITKSILNSVIEQVSELEEGFELSDLMRFFQTNHNEIPSLDQIQTQLQNKLRGKKFLLVLDDMWNENFEDWERLKLTFQVAAQGSKIVMTTRSKIVSSILSGTPAYHLDIVSHNDCWTIIKTTAGLSGAHENERIRLKVAKQCKGLPLAAKGIGSVLRYKSGEGKWDALLKCELWESPEHGNHIYPALKLSYDNLSSYLRRCFTYCSIFPRDHEFEKDDLVQLWAAEGFIQAQGRREIEDVGREYFGGLCSRSFFQVSDDDQPRYKMHDLIHDLARLISTNVSFSMEDNMSTLLPSPRHARYSSLLCQDIKLEVFHSYEKLRTFILLSKHAANLNQVPYDFFTKLGRLRVLNLSRSGISDLPDSIKNLTHLRYLNLSHTSITSLPKSVEYIYWLETLKLKNCSQLRELPENLKNLIKLRHLYFDGYRKISSMPKEVGKLTRLETLPGFKVGKLEGCHIGELKNMNLLRGSICIIDLDNVANSVEGETAMLHKKENLEKLELEWNEMEAQTVEQDVLKNLKPHVGLRVLRVTGYCGLIFPDWISDSSFCKLEKIDLDECRFCERLPSLGQLPALKDLHIHDIRALENVDSRFCGSAGTFPSLETLTFQDMPKLKIWSGITENDMPRLRVLRIDSCPELVTLPSIHYLRSLEMLEINCCPELQSLPREGPPLSLSCLIISNSDILKERCEVRGADWDKIKSVPTIMIDDEVIPVEGREN